MLRGYKDPSKFGPSVQVCVDCAMDILEVFYKLDVLQAPIQAFGSVQQISILPMRVLTFFGIPVFLGKHLLSACTTLFIDVMHDVDIRVPAHISDAKLKNLPAALKWLNTFELTASGMKQEVSCLAACVKLIANGTALLTLP